MVDEKKQETDVKTTTPTTIVDRHPMKHLVSKLDSRYSGSFSSDTSEELLENLTLQPDEIHAVVATEDWSKQTLSVVVIGASGDLAKKKTYPSLLGLYMDNLLPPNTIIWGYARSKKTHDELRKHLYPHLMKVQGVNEIIVQQFLSKCYYHYGKSYGDLDSYKVLMNFISDYELTSTKNYNIDGTTTIPIANRLFYLAIPPNVFGETGITIKQVGMTKPKTSDDDTNGPNGGWTRLIIEKPFGHDLQSCTDLLQVLSNNFNEDQLYRIDHYLGKEIVQNMLLLRFGNSWLHWIWNNQAIESVHLQFKEPFGTEGRGGYFDSYGIIRDIIQNHLLQVLTLVACEPPLSHDGDSIRDAKMNVLQHIDPVLYDATKQNILLGQYNGYSDDPTIKNKDTVCPTYAAVALTVNTPRWNGVPFVLEAGKALDERVCQVKIKFRSTPTFDALKNVFEDSNMEQNELVLRLQPDPAIEFQTNIKTPGFSNLPMSSKLTMNYAYEQQCKLGQQLSSDNNEDVFDGIKKSPSTTPATTTSNNPDAYTRLLLNTMRGQQGSFVRDDELRRSWEIFTPLLHQLERDHVQPKSYKYGSTGPIDRDEWFDTKLHSSSSSTTTTTSPQQQSSL